MTFTSATFEVETVDLAGQPETILRGGRHLFPLLPEAFAGVRRIGVIGWGSQGRAQALNLRDSLAGSPVTVTVGLRPGSASVAEAEAAGFDRADGTLGDWLDVVQSSDLVLLLISDAAAAEHFPAIFDRLRPGSTLGLSHGFLTGHLRTVGADFPQQVGVVAVCPKGMGDSVRRLYLQGAETDGAGINASFAVVRDLDGYATDRALAWSVAIGSPYTFQTTLDNEYRSDLVGERAILLGAVHGIAESLYQRYRLGGDEPELAFERSAESITAAIAPTVSRQGPLAVRDQLAPAEQTVFDTAYAATYRPARVLTEEIYDEVDSGNELRSVVLAANRLARTPWSEIGGSPMWSAGRSVRARRSSVPARTDPFTAGVLLAVLVAQVDVLAAYGHPWSEIVNESVIELVDSLLPYMHARGVDFMVDNCSVTARLGARKWGPRFQAILDQVIYPAVDSALDDRNGESAGGVADTVGAFVNHPLHEVMATLAPLRPAVDIAVR